MSYFTITCLQLSCNSKKKQKGFVFCEELFTLCSYHAGILASCICVIGV
jgi:hypothetical protein